jgi:osmotically-inducible protein OsmY
MTDVELGNLIDEVLCSDTRVDRGEVSIRVKDGIVHVSGTVDSAAERHAAIEDIQTVVLAKMVVDSLKLKNYVERTDEELRAEVRQALARDKAVDVAGVAVNARAGTVVLDGTVESRAQKLAIESVAWWTPGVTEVVNRLRVEGIPEPPDDADY